MYCIYKELKDLEIGIIALEWKVGIDIYILYINLLNYYINYETVAAAAAAAKSLQSCPTLYDPIESSPPGSSVHGIFQARVLEWGAIAFSN